jgi:hypothetical protein
MIEPSTLMSRSVQRVVDTGADAESTVSGQNEQAVRRHEAERQRELWQEAIDRRLIEWGRDPTQLEDDGLEAPSISTISLASKVAVSLRDLGCPAPTNVVPDTDRGIVFERREGSTFESFRIMRDGIIDYARLENFHLVERHPLILDSSIAAK